MQCLPAIAIFRIMKMGPLPGIAYGGAQDRDVGHMLSGHNREYFRATKSSGIMPLAHFLKDAGERISIWTCTKRSWAISIPSIFWFTGKLAYYYRVCFDIIIGYRKILDRRCCNILRHLDEFGSKAILTTPIPW